MLSQVEDKKTNFSQVINCNEERRMRPSVLARVLARLNSMFGTLIRRALLSLPLVVFASSFAYNSAAWGQSEEQVWASGQLTKLIPDSPWRLGLEGIYRYSKTRDLTTLQSFRTSVGYRLESQTILTFIHESSRAAISRDNELRLAAQVSHRFSFDDLDLGLRVRHEHRLFQDSEVWQHRSRAQVRLAFKGLQFAVVTPFLSQEIMYIWNTVEARSAGSFELRSAIGGSLELTDRLNLDVALQDRQTYSDWFETRAGVLLINAAFVF